jgi:radical SAM superfamily enzyme YgiQ (UPF0313 family)
MIVEPLELEILATTVQENYEVRIVDMILEKAPIEHFIIELNPDVVCITGYITHIPVIISHCEKIKSLNNSIVTVVGGVHVEKFPEDLEHNCIDYRVVRNAVIEFPRLLDHIFHQADLPKGALKKGQKKIDSDLPDFDFHVPIPDRSLTKEYRHKYFYVFHDKVALIKTSFGCPYTCNFCFCREITDGIFFARPLNDVFKELQSIQENEIYIVDDDFLLDRNRIIAFNEELERQNLKKKFLVYGRADFIVKNPDIIERFKKNGLRTIIVGLESFNETELKSFNKKTTSTLNEQAMHILNKAGVDCYAAIIISPSWTRQDFRLAEKVMKRLKLKFINLQPLTPLKGISLNVSDEKLAIPRSDFAKWDLAHVTVTPDHMTTNEFYQEILRLYEKVTFDFRNWLSHMKYPLHMQVRLIKGMWRVHKQYKNRILEAK